MPQAAIGHNVSGIEIEIEVRLFNSVLQRVGGDVSRPMVLPAGSSVADVLAQLRIRTGDVFLVMCNGRDITRGLISDGINVEFAPEHGDVIAISGAVPYSWGYGAPVV